MVKQPISKSRIFQNFKNLSGLDTILKIDKQGKAVVVTLEQKIFCSLLRNSSYLLGTVLIFILICLFNLVNFNLIYCYTAITFSILLYKVASIPLKESLIMIHPLGFQVSSEYVLGKKDLFIPWSQIQCFFINEVIVKHRVIHLLTILIKHQRSEKLIPLFEGLEPRLQHLELICKHLKGPRS